MLEVFEKFHLDILVAVGVPALGAFAFIVRHFWAKTKCFYLMQQRLETLEKEAVQGKKTHIEIYKRLNEIDKHTANIEGKIDILIKSQNG